MHVVDTCKTVWRSRDGEALRRQSDLRISELRCGGFGHLRSAGAPYVSTLREREKGVMELDVDQ